MTLVPGICTQCGATLSADNTRDYMICPYCNTPFAIEKAINNFQNTYNITNSTVNIYGNSITDYVIQAGVLMGYNGKSMEVSVPDNVKKIGKNAFHACERLVSVRLSDSVDTIEREAFYNCISLKSIILSNKVNKIGAYAFGNCKNLVDLEIPDGIEVIEAGVFYNCTNLKNVKLPNSLKVIDVEAFEGCINLKEIVLPKEVIKIREFAFRDCKKLEKVIMSSEIEIHYEAFYGTKYGEILNAKKEEKIQREQEIIRRKYSNRCVYCGGQFKGLFNSVCRECGKPKDY